MPTIKFELEGDGAVLAAVDKFVRANEKNEQSLRKNMKAAGDYEKQLQKTQKAFDGDYFNRQLDKTRMATEKATAAAKEMQAAFASGKGGLSGAPDADKWFAGMNKIGTAAAKARENKRLAMDSMAESITSANMTPLESYRQKLSQLNELQSRLAPATYARALGEVNAQYYKASGAAATAEKAQKRVEEQSRAAAAAQKENVEQAQRLANEVKQLTTTPLDRYVSRMAELRRGLKQGVIDQKGFNAAAKEAKANLDAAGNAGKSAFGGAAMEQLAGYAMSMVSLSAAIGLVKRAFDTVPEARDKAIASLESKQDANEKLAQLSGGDSSKVKELFGQRDYLAREYGLTPDEAANAVFEVESAELNKEQLNLAGRSGQVGDAGSAAKFMGVIKNVYKDEVTPERGLRVAFKTAADAPGMDFDELTQRMPVSMPAAKELGLSIEDTAAIIGNMQEQIGVAGTTLERFEVLAGRMSIDKQFRGQGLAGFKKLADASDADMEAMLGDTTGMSPEDAESFLGKRKEMREAIRAIRTSGHPKIEAYSRELKAAGESDVIGAAAEARFSIPTEKSQLDLRKQKERETQTREKALGKSSTDIQTLFSAEREKDEERKVWATQRLGRATYQGLAYGLQVEPGTAHAMSEFGSQLGVAGPLGAIPEAIDVWRHLLGINTDQAAVLKEISSKLDTPKPIPRPPPPAPNGGGVR